MNLVQSQARSRLHAQSGQGKIEDQLVKARNSLVVLPFLFIYLFIF